MSNHDLFPPPHRLSIYSPQTASPLAGVTDASSVKLVELLKLNYERFHVFHNDMRFQNHLPQHLFAAYSLGGSPSLLQEIYDLHASYQRPAFRSPEKITQENWKQHLGNELFYDSYLEFFVKETTSDRDLGDILEQFVFSPEVNWGPKGTNIGAETPRMFCRFMSALFHPLIHFGHVEFGMLGMAAEGLARLATTMPNAEPLFPPEFFELSNTVAQPTTRKTTFNLSSTLLKLTIFPNPASAPTKTPDPIGTHSFTILARMLKDPRLAPGEACEYSRASCYLTTVKNCHSIIRPYADKWVVPLDATQIESKIEELGWLTTMIFGLGGWREGKGFRTDLYSLHLLTSSLFLPSIVVHLPLPSQRTFLRGYLTTVLAQWVSRGRPSVPIRSFFAHTTPSPTPPSAMPTPHPTALGKSTPCANPWFALAQATLVHPEEHHVKGQRTLLHYGMLYGGRPIGYFADVPELDGLEDVLDGTLFVRVAGELMNSMGWVNEGQPAGQFGGDGLGWDCHWE